MNRYDSIKKLGSGNFGTAWLVTEKKTGSHYVAKKILVGNVSPDETIGAVQEGKLLSKLNHPYIIRFKESFLDRDHFCIITEFCESGDLEHVIKKTVEAKTTIPKQQIIDW
eukprot:Colp12_sorted_trinity150504_noHs@17017